MAFCGNVVELVPKHKVMSDKKGFTKWNKLADNYGVDVFLENDVISELQNKSEVLIDAALGNVNGKEMGMLFIQKGSNVYG